MTQQEQLYAYSQVRLPGEIRTPGKFKQFEPSLKTNYGRYAAKRSTRHTVTEQATVKLLLVDEHTLYRKVVLLSLKADPRIEVVGVASNAKMAVSMIRELRPDVVLSDIHMRDGDGFQFIEEMTDTGLESPALLVMTGDNSEQACQRAFSIGVSGYLLKENVTEDGLLSAVHAVANGGKYVDQQMFGHLTEPHVVMDQSYRVSNLNAAKIELLRLVALGYDNKKIAHLLSVSLKTVSNRLSILYTALGVNNRVHAANIAYRSNILKLQDVVI